ncbi:MAG: serine/threonine protein kinase [Planctomycetaceae bacterium]|nr:serine/threonine protein kinase [Planctomycetaceae bacterium]
MSLKLTAESFLAGVRASGLINHVTLDKTLAELRRHGRQLDHAADIAEELLKRGLITAWQSEKLLQGRHKGFVLGRYKLLDLLGRGEMSAVYLAEHIAMQRRCAIKVLPANRVKDTSYLGRFQREARAVASLDHPNIVRAYDVDQQNEGGAEIHFLVMEYVSGTSIEQIVKEKGKLPYVQIADIIRQSAEGLEHAHQAGLIHRDIKPGNLLVSEQGTVKLLDLGLARFFKEDDEESLTIKHDEKVLGTADYLAPEQAVDSHNVDQRGDIYSLGCTFYFALAGHPPFTDGSLVQRLLAHQTRQPPSIKIDRPDIPDDLLAIVDKMMAKRREDRYQTAKELADELTRWLSNHGTDEWKQKNIHLISMLYGAERAAEISGFTQPNQPGKSPAGDDPFYSESEKAKAARINAGRGSRKQPQRRAQRPDGTPRPQRRRNPAQGTIVGRNSAHAAKRKVSQAKSQNQMEAHWILIAVASVVVTLGIVAGVYYLMNSNRANNNQSVSSPTETISAPATDENL